MTEVWCHRGYSGRYPENTLLAFREAINTGAEGIELDVRLTRDGEVVILHDETLDRTTDGFGRVGDMTLSELRKYNAGKKFPAFGFQPVPTLDEYLALAAQTGIFTNIELKESRALGLEEKVWKLISEYGLQRQVLISSFHQASLLRMVELAGPEACGYLTKRVPSGLPEQMRSLGLTACNPRYFCLTKGRCMALADRGLQVNAYTPNFGGTLRRLIRWGVHAVITNEPVRALNIRDSLNS